MEPAAGTLDLSALAPDHRRAVEALMASNAKLAEINKRQEALIQELRHALHGKKSERLTEDERQLSFEDLEIAVAEVEEAVDQAPATPSASRKKRAPVNRNIGNLPESLPRIEEVIEPESTLCPCGCGQMQRIGEDRTERLDIVPSQLRVIVTIRPKYACRACTDGVTQAPARAWLIEGAMPTEGAIAYVLVSKYADHCPLYRQSQILARSGIDLDRSTLAGWVGKAAFHLGPVVDRLAEHLKRSTKLFMDETTAPVLDPGRGRTKTGFLWALARDDRNWGGADPPGVVYFYAPGRGGEHAETVLDGFDGVLQIDGYPGYNRLTRTKRQGGDPITVAHCWAHARRKLREVFDRDGSAIAAEGLERIRKLYEIGARSAVPAPGSASPPARPARRPWLRASANGWQRFARESPPSRASAKSSPTSTATGTDCRPSSSTAGSKSTPTGSRT